MRRPTRIVLLICAGLMIMTLPLGCAQKGPQYVDEGAVYSKTSVLKVLDEVDISELASSPSTDAPKLRHEALVALRSNSDSAAAVADLLSETFPASTRGVPVLIERAKVDGKPAIIIVEAAGPRGGKLSTKRLWALDEQGEVIVVGTK